ncbi:hypothetical protein CFP71_40930 [Amycolatopsis thailandensis]|uniref:Uncharacterized protein n=1 Tax=Amycolatopsis thailandensis TaxID=589330 RepID=A0A229RBR3_9PSEU|nr:hypothetical protein CFP71_40930 [Amycolatopsis thailandensis]
MEALGEASDSLASMTKTAAADVVKAKVMMVAMAAMALATIIHLLATLIFAFMAGAAILTARAALTAVWRALVAKMRALAGLRLTKELGVQLAKGVGRASVPVAGFAAVGAGIMGGLDLSIQLGQIATGKRAELDGKSLLGTFVGGALGGAFAGIFHAGAVWLRGVASEGAGQAAGRVAAEAAEDVVVKVAAKEAADAVDDAVPGGVAGKTGGEKGPEATVDGEKAVEAPKRAIPGSVEALGHLTYGAGQVGVVFITAPVINAATGSPHASPWLGMLGALSGFGGGRNGSSGSGAGSLDAVMTALDHLPRAPQLTVPAADIKTGTGVKTDGLTTGERLFFEPPPSYADTIAADPRAADLANHPVPARPLEALFAPMAGERQAVPSALDNASSPAIAITSGEAGMQLDRPGRASPITTVLEESPATAVAPIAGERTSIAAPLPLPSGVGIAFVDPAYLGNVTKAFAGHAPGVLPVAVHHRDGSVILPDSSGRPVSRDYGRFAGELAGLAPWGEISKIELYACDVTPENVAGLNTALRTVPALAHVTLTPHRVNERLHVLPDGSDLSGDVPELPPGTLTLAPGTPPPLDVLTWRPPVSAVAAPQDLNGYIRQRGIVAPRNFDAVLRNGWLSPELGTAVRDEVGADTGPPPLSWVRSWAEGMESASGSLGLHHRPSDVARATGALLNEHEIAQAWGRARVTFESALDVRGGLDQTDSLAIRSMIEGFVDAAVQARPNALPQVQAGVFVGPDSTTGLTELGRLIEWSVRSRLREYPADVVTPSAGVLLTRVAVSALTRPVADGRIGVVQLRVDGQRGLSGLYGPKAYASSQNLLSAELSAELANARAVLPTVGDTQALAEARAIMNRYHQPPRAFVEREPSRLHRAHGERHEAATLLVAWELFNYFDQVAAESRARQLIDFVGWPRQSGILGGRPAKSEPLEAGPSTAEAALVAANMYGEENLIALLPDDVDPAVPTTAWRNSSVHSIRFVLRESGHGDTDPALPAERAELAHWGRITGDRRPTPLVLALWQGDSGFRVGRENLDPVETLLHLQKSEAFRRFPSESPRPPLVVLVDGKAGELTAQFLAALRAATGPVHFFLYEGPFHFDPEGTIRVPREAEFTEEFGVRLDDVRYVNEGISFAFLETGNQAEVDGAGEVAAAAVVEWGTTHDGPFPQAVVLPGDDAMVPIGLRTGAVRVPAGGEEIAQLYLEDRGIRDKLAADPDWPILLVADSPPGEARPGDVRFDFSAALAREGFFNPVYATTRHAPDTGRVFQLVSGLYADRVQIALVSTPDDEPAAVFVRHEGDEAALDTAWSWAEHEDAAGVHSVKGPDGENVPVPWNNAVPIFVKPDADGRVHLVRIDGVPATGVLGAALRDSRRVRSALGDFADGRAPHLEWTPLLVPVEGNITGLREFSRAFADGGYSRAIYATRGPVILNDDGTITLTEAGFDHVPAVAPDLAKVASYPLVNARLGVHGQFFPRDDTDMLVQWRAGASTGPVSGQLYFSETSKSAGSLYFDTYLAPGGEPSWHTVVHGNPTSIEVALSTGRPYELGDRIGLEGDEAGAALFGSAVYRMAQPDPHRPYWMLACKSAENAKLAHAIESRWGTGPVLGLTETAKFRWTGAAVHVDNGGHLTAVNRPQLRNPALEHLAAEHIGPRRIERRDGDGLGADVLDLSRRAVRASAWRLANGGEPAEIRIVARGGDEADGLAWGERIAAGLRTVADEEAALLTAHYRLPDVRERPLGFTVAFEDGGQRPMVAVVEVVLPEGDFGADAVNPRYLDEIETAFDELALVARDLTVAVLELPRGLGVGFVDPAYTRNVTRAFAEHEPGVLPVAVHHREGRWALPGGRATSRQFADALVALPASLVTWPEITRLRLYACYLTPGIVTGLQAAMRELPALEHVTVSAAYSGGRVHFLPDGEIVAGDGRNLPRGTLTLARDDENAGSGAKSRRSARKAASSLLTGVREVLSTVTHRPRRKGKEAAESSRPAIPREVPGSPAADDGSLYVRPRTPDRYSRENELPPLDVVSFRPPLAEQPGPKTWYDHVLRRGLAGEGKLDELVKGLAQDLGAGLTKVPPLPREVWELVRDQVELDPIPSGWVRPWAEAMDTSLDRTLPWYRNDHVVEASGYLLNHAEADEAWRSARVAYEMSDRDGGYVVKEPIKQMLKGFVDAAVQAHPDALPRVTGSISLLFDDLLGPSWLRALVGKTIRSRLAEYPPGAVTVSAEQLLARVSLSTGGRDGENRGLVSIRVDGQRALSGLYGPVAFSDADNPLDDHKSVLTVNWKTIKETHAVAVSAIRALAPDDPVFTEAREMINRTQEPPRESGARHPSRVYRAHRSRYDVAVDIVAWQLAMARADVTRADTFRDDARDFVTALRGYLDWPRESAFSGGARVLPASSPTGVEVSVLALPHRFVVAFVDPGYAANVAQAFPGWDNVVPVVVHHRNGLFELPRPGHGPVPHDFGQFAQVLATLPGRLVSWSGATGIELYACDLTPGIVDSFEAAVKAVPGLNHLTVSAPKQGAALHLRTDGTFDQGDRAVQPPGTLTLAGASGAKPPRSARAADPDNPSHRHAHYSAEYQERVRAELARLRPDDPAFTEARGLMDRLYEPPRDFAGQELPLPHRLHRKRYQVVLDKIAMQLARAQRLAPRWHYVAMSRQHLHEYVDFVGRPRRSASSVGARAMFAPSGAGGEVAALPLRHNAGVAFVESRYATNVALAFARHPSDHMPVAVHHRQGRWVLPDADGTQVPHDHGQFAGVLGNLPAGLISWGGISWIELFACDLRDEDVAGLNDALRAVPALSHITARAAWSGTRINLVSDGRVLFGEHADLPPGTLTLTPADSSGTSSSDAGTPPAGVLAWRPGGPDRTLNDLTRRLSIANETNFSRFMRPGRFGSLAPELWRLIQEQVTEDPSPTPRGWARSWIETMDSVRTPEGELYRSEDLAMASGILNAWEVDQARGRAREAFEGRLGDDGELDRDSVASIELMVDGFVDAAVRANPDALPMIQAAVFAEQGSTGGTTLVRSLVEAQIRFRSSQYPASALEVPMERLLSRVSLSLRTPQAGDERIGKVEVRVDGQREVSGLYGPGAFSDPDDPLPLHRDELEEARRDLADMDRNGPVFLDARRIMNRFHQPPRVFADEEPRIHQAHRERHQAATDLVAWDLTKPPHRYIDDNVRLARQRAQALLGPVGWPR